MKKSTRTKGKVTVRDLGVKKRAGAAVKGGRITNVRANASGISAGPSGTPGSIQA
jgi:hypothetical protein